MSDRPAIRILLVDDHEMVREGIARIIGSQPGMEVVAQASGVVEALRLRGTPVDVIVLDVSLPEGDGLTHIPRIRRAHPDARILVLSMQPELPYAPRSLEAGASGYLMKGSPPSALIDAIRTVAAGRRHLSSQVSEALASRAAGRSPLSPRELEVLRHLAGGETVTEIATRLHLSVKTVSTFKSRLQTKLGVSSFADLVRYADAAGLTGVPAAVTTGDGPLTDDDSLERALD